MTAAVVSTNLPFEGISFFKPENNVKNTVDAQSSIGSLGSRCWSVLCRGSEVVSRVMSTYDGIDYGAKFFGGILLTLRLNFPGSAVLDSMSDHVVPVFDFTGAISLPGRINIFTSGEYKQKTIYKNIYTAFLIAKSTSDSIRWLAGQGVLNLAKVASAIGGTRAAAFVTMGTLKTFSSVTCIIGCLFDIAGAAKEIPDAIAKGKPTTKLALTIACDIGKIGCCILSPYMMTCYFAACSLYTGALCLWKTAYDRSLEM